MSIAWLRLEKLGIVGEQIQWLYIDPQTLSEKARRRGWESELLCGEGDGNYLARLTPSKRKRA